jgi:hypothetical protein
MDFLKNNATWVILGVAAAMLALIVTLFTYLGASFASTDSVTAIKEVFDKHVTAQETINATQTTTLEMVATKLRHEIKQARIEELTFEKKMILIIDEDKRTEHDRKVMALLDLEIDTLNGR